MRKTATIKLDPSYHLGQMREHQAQEYIDRFNKKQKTTLWRKDYSTYLDTYDDSSFKDEKIKRSRGFVWVVKANKNVGCPYKSEKQAKFAKKEASEIKSLFQHKPKNNVVYAIVEAKEWYKQHNQLHYPVLPNDYVVCKWYYFSDGTKNIIGNIEGKETIAICRKLSDAKVVFDSYKKRNPKTKLHKPTSIKTKK